MAHSPILLAFVQPCSTGAHSHRVGAGGQATGQETPRGSRADNGRSVEQWNIPVRRAPVTPSAHRGDPHQARSSGRSVSIHSVLTLSPRNGVRRLIGARRSGIGAAAQQRQTPARKCCRRPRLLAPASLPALRTSPWTLPRAPGFGLRMLKLFHAVMMPANVHASRTALERVALSRRCIQPGL